MPDMHGLGDVRSAEIQDRTLARAAAGKRRIGIGRKALQPLLQDLVLELEIDEARSGNGDICEQARIAQPRRDLLGDGSGICLGELRRGQRPIALELREVGAVGELNLPKLHGQTFGRERGACGRGKLG